MTSKRKISEPFSVGLDIGIASVGWAILAEDRVIDLGVRCFNKAETAEKGESLNLARRTARLTRRRLRRRAWRLTKLARLLKREGLIPDSEFFKKQTPITPTTGKEPINLWTLRVEALDRILTDEEWARVIYHICKHRGFHWISRAEMKAADNDNEGGQVKKGLSGTKRLMVEHSYRTAAEMILKEFPEAQRNKAGEYSKALSRELISEELKQLFECQRNFNNPHASTALEETILGYGDKKSGIFWKQEPALSGASLLKMLGKCTFEKAEYRAPKASFTAERHVWLTRLNNLRVIVDGHSRPFTSQERALALLMPYEKSTLSYKQLRSALTKAGYFHDTFRFGGLSYPTLAEDGAKNPEDERLVKLDAWHTLKNTLTTAGLETEWLKISTPALEGDSSLFDNIAWVLSVYKEDAEVEKELRKLNLPSEVLVIDVLMETRFDRFSNLSLKALHGILPHMELGLRYDEACINAGYHHSQVVDWNDDKHLYLPPLYSGRDVNGSMLIRGNIDAPKNPVVLRALNQARKVINAIVSQYGSPHQVHIEMARDLSRPLEERRQIESAQEEFRERNQRDKESFAENFNVQEVKGREFEKWQLYREQQGRCVYSLNPIDINRLFEIGYVEIDHAIPYSRSYDDSKNNRVLVLTRENRNKGNLTPYEYLGGKSDSTAWREFSAFVKGNVSFRQAKRNRLLRKDFEEKNERDFIERNLNDTRYICRFFKSYLEQNLRLHDQSKSKRCVIVSGQMTSFMRLRWGLVKVREESDRHHALDAAVVAACSHSMVKRLSDYSRKKELQQVRKGFIDPSTGEVVDPVLLDKLEKHFPIPWPGFRDELLTRLFTESVQILRDGVSKLGTYSQEEIDSAMPVFVSRAPQRRNGGAVHKDTVYAKRDSLELANAVSQKKSVADLKLSDFDNLIEPHRNERLYTALREWVTHRDMRKSQAKSIEKAAKAEKRELIAKEISEIHSLLALPRKPDKNGMPTGPIVRSVTAVINNMSGIPIRCGIAKNDSMIRVDIFKGKQNNKFHIVPVYVHHRVNGLPNNAVVAYKDENEWTLMDSQYSFMFSLYPNDLVKITLKNELHVGYYAGADRATGAVNIWAHDRSVKIGKKGLIRGIGIKTALNCEKFNVDVLGRVFLAPPEVRSELA